MDTTKISFLLFALTFLAVGCATTKPKIPTDMTSSQPGTQVSFKGNPLKLLGLPYQSENLCHPLIWWMR